jgi:plastocyanin
MNTRDMAGTEAVRGSGGARRRRERAFGVLVAAAIGLGCSSGVPAAQAQLGTTKPVTVAVRSLTFVPKKVDAKVKQKINFVWRENVAHNVVFDKTRKSPTQNKGSWTTSFDKPGTYKYKCTLHPGMVGEIKVK